MKNFIFILAVIILTLFAAGCTEQITVKGWDHGVVLCDAESIVIELGHEKDPQVQELLDRAKECKE